ncbi:uncharacterized protein LOC130734577 isoform X2 [Lotus japonicus]|uniref:uncharacterized protein LOC130734577 isoform X2 n=1 Tax=Lotus japonicus TaxID=34305 RepID=UPI00258A0C7B|nr:uncharacterized protein LOC130734577 isoform X2 [Lotus japonicus]
MVAISLYRGNLHRVPDVPRRWLMPNPKISIKNFKSLLDRRSKALSRHHHPTTSNPNPNPNPLSNHGEGPSNAAVKEQQQQQQQPHRKESELVAGNSDQKPLINSKNNGFEKASNGAATSIEKQAELPVTDNGGMLTDNKQKRKREVEDKLQVLNGKKHNLVLVLKQILNAEEELKRRNSVLQPGVAMRGMSILPQPDGTNDNGSMTRHMTTRSEGNIVGDVDGGGEADDSANHNVQYSRHVLRTSSMSPSSESPLRRTPNVQPNVVMFHTLLEQVWGPLLVHRDLLFQDIRGIP